MSNLVAFLVLMYVFIFLISLILISFLLQLKVGEAAWLTSEHLNCPISGSK